jgi:hypothetical protein
MREANRRAFVRAVSADPGIEMLQPFKFSRDGADALSQLSHDVVRAIGETFRVVGGTGELDADRLERFVKRLGSDDCLRIDGDEFVVEYDERLHFTTFRASTLASSLYDRLRVGFDLSDYASVCCTVRMPAASGRAHNDSAHRDFKCPTIPGECRHRQRAFYDFLKDVLLGMGLDGLPWLIRISDLTDLMGGHPVGEIVEAGASATAQAFTDLLRRRARWATRG